MSSILSTTAPAKINLFLHVRGRRRDGFHELETLFATVGLEDRLWLRASDADGVSLQLVPGDAPERADAPVLADQDNLVCRAARLFCETVDVPARLEIALQKNIPAGAGLGGGSSDAAAVLRMCALFHGVELPRERWNAMAARLGSDVPFFLEGGCQLGHGRGEVLQPVVDAPEQWVVLLVPPFPCHTGAVYEILQAPWIDHAMGDSVPPDAVMTWEAIDWTSGNHNGLQEAACSHQPRLAALVDAVRAAGLGQPLLAGSGSTLCLLCADQEAAAALAEKVNGLAATGASNNPWAGVVVRQARVGGALTPVQELPGGAWPGHGVPRGTAPSDKDSG